jgi:cathepsin A (carboxypeptidase C)
MIVCNLSVVANIAVSQQCDKSCFPIEPLIEKYLNRPDVRRQLGVDDSVPEFEICSNKILREFNQNGDKYISTTAEVVSLLEKQVSVLIYAGEFDWIWYSS